MVKRFDKNFFIRKVKKIIKKVLIFFYGYISIKTQPRGINSVGRVPVLHAGCQEFESPILHQLKHKSRKALFLLSGVDVAFLLD